MIRLAVVRFRAGSLATLLAAGGPEPVFYLSGGPGQAAAPFIAALVQTPGDLLMQWRDVVIFDQRGVGKSQPELGCPELPSAVLGAISRPGTAAEDAALLNDGWLRCRDRLSAEGIDLAAYNTAANTADVDAIRLALGYERISLLGISYGTRLGMAALADFPGTVSSIVLDSALPPGAGQFAEIAPNYASALQVNFAECARQGICPDMETPLRDFEATYDALNRRPQTVTVHQGGGDVPIVLTGPRFVELVQLSLYSAAEVTGLPAMLAAFRRGDAGPLTDFTARALPHKWEGSQGMHASVTCGDMLPGESVEQALASLDQTPRPIAETYAALLPAFFELCELWPHAAPVPQSPSVLLQDTPVLILQNGNDPATPPANGRLTASLLPRSIYVETPGVGHSVLMNGGVCAWQITASFLADPAHPPDTSCVPDVRVYYQP